MDSLEETGGAVTIWDWRQMGRNETGYEGNLEWKSGGTGDREMIEGVVGKGEDEEDGEMKERGSILVTRSINNAPGSPCL